MQIRLTTLVFLFITACSASVLAGEDTTLLRIEKIRDYKNQVDAYNLAIEHCWRLGYYEQGLKYAEKALKKARSTGYKKGEAEVLNNTGIIYDYQGNFAKSLTNYFKALRIQETIGDEKGLAYTCSNIGLIYSNQRNFEEALRYHKRSLAIRKKLNFLPGLSASHNNIGIIYMNQKRYDAALEHYFEAVKIDSALRDLYGLSDTYNNIGIVYMQQDQFDLAEKYYLISLDYRTNNKDQLGIATCYNNLGTLLEKKGDYTKAEEWLLKGIAIGKALGSKENVKYSYQILYSVQEKCGKIKDAFNSYKLFITYGDSITNEANTRLQTQTEMQYAFDKKEAKAKLDQQRKDLISRKSKEQVQLALWAVVIIALIIFIFSMVLYKRWKIVQGQKLLIEEKNRLVEEKNREIMDSISYAKRIQTAILPPEKLVKEFLVNSFILYKPKDIVAGDFYWMEAQENTIIFAAADCTGHGVPGALVSVVCHNALNRSVREFGLLDPGAILDKTREIIIEEFAKSEDDVNDGMDISLCALNTDTLEVKWSGANNPLWIVRRQSNEVIELKANKQPIGRYSRYESFLTHTIKLEKGDSLYLFTDGFADQFGGEDAKKFKSKNMKDLILRVKDAPMNEQKYLFEKAFEDWKGDLEQVDDVCVLGITV